jgi:DNA-binding MarR family transcriptional regulator
LTEDSLCYNFSTTVHLLCETARTMKPMLTIENQILASLRRTIRAVDLQSRRLVDRFGLTGPQLVVLQAAAELEPVTAGALAAAVHLSRPTITGILDRLGEHGLIHRVRSEHDRRQWLITITPRGRKILDKAPSPLQDRFRAELARLEDWEQSQILATLQRVASMMEAEDLDAAPVLATGSVEADRIGKGRINDEMEMVTHTEAGVSGNQRATFS